MTYCGAQCHRLSFLSVSSGYDVIIKGSWQGEHSLRSSSKTSSAIFQATNELLRDQIIRWLFGAMSDGQWENMHTCTCVRTCVSTHTRPFLCFASVANVWTRCICSRKNNAKGKNTSVIMKEHCCVPQRALDCLFLCLVFPVIINLIWDGECGANKCCFCVVQDWGNERRLCPSNRDISLGLTAATLRSEAGGSPGRHRRLMASVRLVLALNQGPQKAFMSHFFLKFFFTFVFSLSLSADLLPSMLKNHSFKRWDLFVLFYLFFRASCFHFIDVIIFPLSKFMN